jgi:serine/threonine-protein kinase RsbW
MRENETGHGESVLTLDSDIVELERLTAFVDAFCQRETVPAEACSQLQVALEELALNVIKYGECEPKKDAIRLAIRREGDEVRAVLCDTGVFFNPLDVPPPDLTSSVQDRPLGGLGIHLVRNLLESIRYERCEGRNYLYFVKRLNPDSDKADPEGETHANRIGDYKS